jgi:preprotein translocase subunit YajC
MDNDVNADVVEARFILVFFFLIWKQKKWQEREREEFANKISETGTCCVLAVDPYVF